MLRHSDEEREGRLLRRLKDVGAGPRSGRLGFVTDGNGIRGRALVVVARATQGPDLADQMRALVEAGADAIEIVPRPGAGWIATALNAVEVPCGLLIAGELAADDVDVEDTAGLDWIHLGTNASARHLAAGGITRLVDVASDMPPGRLAGLAGLKSEVVVVEGPPGSSRFSVDTLMALTAIEATVKRPLLAASSLGVAPEDAAVLRDHGIEGVLLSGGSGVVRDFVDAISALTAQ